MCAMALVHARAARVIVGRPVRGGRGVLAGAPGALPGAGAGVRDRPGRKRRGPPPRLHGLAGLNHRYSVWVATEEADGGGGGGGGGDGGRGEKKRARVEEEQ
jgi:hypothetical protein